MKNEFTTTAPGTLDELTSIIASHLTTKGFYIPNAWFKELKALLESLEEQNKFLADFLTNAKLK